MAKYEALPTTAILANDTMLYGQDLPELVHLDDPATSVMVDFTHTAPHTILSADTMDHAIREMEVSGSHLLLVLNESGHFHGILSSKDVWGEKPIKLIQERRVHRDQILVRMIMVPYTEITAVDFLVVEHAKVGHIVKTLTDHRQHYALAVTPNADHTLQIIRGVFIASQISKQLHRDISEMI